MKIPDRLNFIGHGGQCGRCIEGDTLIAVCDGLIDDISHYEQDGDGCMVHQKQFELSCNERELRQVLSYECFCNYKVKAKGN